MRLDTALRAKTILKRGEVIPAGMAPLQLRFLVRQRNGNWAEVWVSKRGGILSFSCNAIERRAKGGWGCPLNVKDHARPFCSHTMAAYLYIKKQKMEGWLCSTQ
jgi:hypothetical protein